MASIFELSVKGTENATRQIDALRGSYNALSKAAKTLGEVARIGGGNDVKIAKAYQNEIKVTETRINSLEKELKKVGNIEAFRTIKGDVESAKTELEELNAELQDLQSKGKGGAGDLTGAPTGGQRAQAVGDVAGSLGGTGFADANAGIAQFDTALTGLADAFPKNAGMIKGFQGTLGKLTPALAGITLGFDLFESAMGRSEEALQKQLSAARESYELNKQIGELTAQGTAAIADRLNVIEQERAALESRRNAEMQAAVDQTSFVDQARTVLESLLKDATLNVLNFARGVPEIFGGIVNAIEGAIKGLARTALDLVRALPGGQQFIDSTISGLQQWANEAATSGDAVTDAFDTMFANIQQWASSAPTVYGAAGDAIRETNNEIAALDREVAALDTSAAQAAAATADMETALKDAARAQGGYERQVTEFTKNNALTDKRAREDENVAKRRDIEDWGKERSDALGQYNKQIGDMLKQDAKDRAASEKAYNEGLVDAQIEAQEGMLAAQEGFYKESEREEKAYAKERRRRLEDLNDDLRNAERGNDVLAFIDAENAANKDLRRAKEDKDEASAERQAAFTDELSQIQQQNAERVSELRDGYAEENDVREAALRERLTEEKASFVESERIAAEARALLMSRAKEDSDLAAKREREDRARQLAEMKRARDEQLAEIAKSNNVALTTLKQRVGAEQNVITTGYASIVATVTGAFAQMQAAARNLAASNAAATAASAKASANNKASQNATAAAKKGAQSATRAGTRRTATAAADGAVTNEPMLTLMGEALPQGYVEAAIPMPKNRLPAAMAAASGGNGAGGGAGGDTFVFNVDAAGATMSEGQIVNVFKSKILPEIKAGIERARSK